jgi:acetyl-CoA carboxylase carboxyltransferase component
MDNVEALKTIKSYSEKGGGTRGIEIQHNFNKLTARERINILLDEGSFIEIGTLVGGSGAGVITGHGTIDGRLVYVFSEDYTVEGGSINVSGSVKVSKVMDMAIKMGAPIIGIYDSVGVKLSEGIDVLGAYGSILGKSAQLSGVVPHISVVAGTCAGTDAICAAMSDFTIMVEGNGEMYINSPEKISEKEAKYIDRNSFGGYLTSSKNGTAVLTAESDREALTVVRKLLAYLPSNNMEITPLGRSEDLIITESRLDEISKEENYDIYELISLIADKDSLLEISGGFYNEVLTGFIKLNGLTVGIIACDKIENNEGLGIQGLEKLTRFVKLCNSFNLPLLSIVDSKGFRISLDEENNGLALWVSKLVYALAEAKVPKVSLIIGEAYGSAYLALASKETSFDIAYAWPSAKVSIGEPQWLAKVLHGDEIINGDNPKEAEKEVVDRYTPVQGSPYSAAEKGYIDDVILPSESRLRLYAVLDMLQSKRELRYPKKHGSVLV